MRKSVAIQCAGLLLLLSSSMGLAATVTITPSVTNPLAGEQFYVTVSGADFPNTAAADLNLTFNSAVVSVDTPTLTNGIVLAPGSPFTNGVIADNPFISGNANGIQALAGFVITPSGSFDAIRINFTVNPLAAPGALASILVTDRDGWTDADTFEAIPVTYTQTSVVVGGVVASPNIVVTDSVAPVDDLLVPFGSVAVGGMSSQTVTVTNSGGADLLLGAVASANPLAAPFSVASDTCSNQTVIALASCTFTVQFQPLAAGAFNDALDIPSNDPDTASTTVSVTGTGTLTAEPNIVVTDAVDPVDDLQIPFGDIMEGSTSTKTVTVTNSGNADLLLGAVASANPLAAPFSIASDTCSNQTVIALASCTFTVQFQPIAAGAFSDVLDIPSNDPDTASTTVSMSGAGTPMPKPDIVVTDSVAPVNDNLVPFGSITVGGMSSQTVTVTNSGNEDLLLGQVASANPLAAPFSIASDTCSNQTVIPLASCTFTVQFQPTTASAFNDSLGVPSNDPDAPSVTVNVTGTGAAVMVPDIAVSDSVSPANDLQVGFGSVAVSTSGDETVTVTNDGAEDLVIGVVGAVNPLAAPFSVVTDTCSSQTLAPDATCTISVRYSPVVTGPLSDSFDIPSNDPDEAAVTVAVNGTGADDILVIDGGSSALDFWSLSLLAGLPLVRRRRR